MKNKANSFFTSIITPLLLLFLLGAVIFFRKQDTCYQLHHLMKEGNLHSPQDFKDSLDFVFRDNLIIVNVEIGEANYPFLFDTGSSTALSDSLSNILTIKQLIEINLTDRQGLLLKEDFFLTNLKIQNTIFENIAVKKNHKALIMNGIYGVIGANLLQHCLWQIDYPKQKIYFSNRLDLLPKHQLSYPISFTRDIYRVPRTYLTINGFPLRPVASVSTADTASITLNRYFSDIRLSMSFSAKELAQTILPPNDTIRSGYAHTLQLASFKAHHIKIKFQHSRQCTLGNDFLKNYVVTIDWKNRKMYLEQ